MRHISTAVLLLLLSSQSFAGDFDKGVEAYEAGDYAAALKELRPLAEQGDAKAQFILGAMYANGRGVVEDDQEAVKWFRLAAEQGDAGAQHNLGVMYRNGDGVIQDYKEAVKWWRLAAEQGLAEAQYNLGLMYANGQGVIQDNAYAHMWWNISASLGYEDAAKNRKRVSERMTSEQIAKAQELARECVKKSYKGC